MSRFKITLSISLVVLLWGLTWPVYKIALEYTPPILLAGMRNLLGGILLMLWLLPKWSEIHWKQCWPIYLISTFFNIIIFNGVQTVGLQYLPSGLFSVIVYLQPVLVVFIAWLWLKESLTIGKVVGMLIGFVGVFIVSLPGISGEISMIGVLLALVTGTGWALGVVYVKKTSTLVHGLWLVAIQNFIGGGLLTGTGLIVESFSSIEWTLPYVLCLLYGSVFGVTIATALYYKLMSAGESSKVSSFTFLVPLIAVIIGTLFLNEPITLTLFIGMGLILLSIYIINRRVPKKQIDQPVKQVKNFL